MVVAFVIGTPCPFKNIELKVVGNMSLSSLISSVRPSIVKIGSQHLVNGLNFFEGTGTGFLVSQEGHVLTCSHVIESLTQIKVGFELGQFRQGTYDANIVYSDGSANKDFAILKLVLPEGHRKRLPSPIRLGDYNLVEVGDEALFLGYPLKVQKITSHRAMISAKGNDILPQANRVNVLQIDGSVNNGNSGGPVINLEGKAVGLVTKKYTEFNRLLNQFLNLGRMTGIAISGPRGSLDVGDAFYRIMLLMKSHINVGIGHAFSINYAKEKLLELGLIPP